MLFLTLYFQMEKVGNSLLLFNMPMERKIERKQAVAIHIASEYGKQLSRNHPEIADDFRSGSTCREIAARYGLLITLTIGIAENAVRAGIKELIEQSEIDEIVKEHLKKNGERRALQNRQNGTGLFAFTPKENRLHGQKSAFSRGLTLWNDPAKRDPVKNLEEGDYCLELAAMPEFQHASPPYKGKPDISKIANKLNATFHNDTKVRTPMAVKLFLSRTRRKSEIVKPV